MKVMSIEVDRTRVPEAESRLAPPSQCFLTIGRAYTVYAIAVRDDVTRYLIVDDLQTPIFLPAFLFSTVRPETPSDWVTCASPSDGLSLVHGPPHIAGSVAAFDAMADQEFAQIMEFWRRIDTGEVAPPWD